MNDRPVDWEKVAAFAILSGDYDANGGPWWDKHLSPFEAEAARNIAEHWRSLYERLK